MCYLCKTLDLDSYIICTLYMYCTWYMYLVPILLDINSFVLLVMYTENKISPHLLI
jgi:hypothetical protein